MSTIVREISIYGEGNVSHDLQHDNSINFSPPI